MKIKDDIQRKISNTDKAPVVPDPFFSALVFLHMAHEFDIQHHDIRQGFKRLDKMEHELMEGLQGESTPLKSGMDKRVTGTDNPFDFMISERIEAWTSLMLHHMEHLHMTGLFVTSNRSVFTEVAESAPSGEIIYDIEHVPIENDKTKEMQDWRNSLTEMIQRCTTDPWSGKREAIAPVPEEKSGKTTSVRICIVPGETPFEFLSRFCPTKQDDSKRKKGGGKIVNTVIGLFEISS